MDSLGMVCRMASINRKPRDIHGPFQTLVLAVAEVTERDIQNDIQRELSRNETRLFRINCGQSYQGRIVEQTPDRLILSPWYPIKLGATGISDLIGWTQEYGRPGSYADDVYTAVFCAIEVKDRGRATPEQLAFIDTVRRAGGRAGVARSVEEARAIIQTP
jgi:VRR-NUC domain